VENVCPKIRAACAIFKKLAKSNDILPMGDNSPDLVALFSSKKLTVAIFF
jgi:hypothetical protein